jgi:uncharacterized membrane protein YgcG
MLISVDTHNHRRRKILRTVSLFLWSSLFSFPIYAQKLEAPLPLRDGYVNDHADVISESTKSNIEVSLRNLEQRTGFEFVIATVPDTGSLSAEQYVQILVKAWGVGSREQGIRGLLLLFSTRNGHYSMYWPVDIESQLPRAYLDQLIGQLKEPLSSGDYDAAITLAARNVIDKLGAQYGFNFDELSREPVNPGAAATPNPPSSTPTLDSKRLFKLYIRLVGMVVGFIVAALIVLKVAVWLFSFGRKREFKPLTIILLIILIIAPLPVVFYLYPSQTKSLHSWGPRAGPFSERSFWAERIFGLAPNRFHVDVWGHITELHITNAAVKSPAELSSLESLTRLRTLKISNTPLEGTLDLTPFRDLEQLDLHGTRLSNLTGLGDLTQLTTLDLSDTNVTDLRALERSEHLNELHLSGLNLEKVLGLENLWRVTRLHLNRCTGIDLHRIALLYRLEEISLEQTDVTDLSPLAGLGSLQRLWLAGSRVSDVTPLAKLKLGLLDIRGTGVERKEAEKSFNHPIVVLYGEKDAAFVQINPTAKRWLIPAFFGSLFLLVLLLWPVPRALRQRPVLVMKRVVRRMIVGVFLVLMLVTLANLEWSLTFYKLTLPQLGGKLMLWAAVAAILWLVLRPLILLLLETKAVNSSRWGVSLLTFSRMIPWIVIVLPLLGLFIYVLRYIASVTSGFFHYASLIIVVWISISMIWPILKLIAPVFIWRRRIKKIQRTLAEDEMQKGLLLEIPLQYSSRSLVYSSWAGFIKKRIERILPSSDNNRPSLLNTFSVGLLDRIRITNDHRDKLLGAVVIIRFGHLEQARPWEFRILRRWLASAYGATWAPLWIVLDSVERPASSSAEIERNLKELESLAPHINGFVRHRLTGLSVINMSPPESISASLEANQLTDTRKLERAGMNMLLKEAFTPVAALCRSVFGFPHLTNRLDTLMRATETAIAFFALVLVAEHENAVALHETYSAGKIDAAINSQLKGKLPDFSSWESILNTFCKRSQSKLAGLIADAWNMPASDLGFELRDHLEKVGGEGTALGLVRKLETRREELTLLRLARNVLTAHGPTLERATPELYLTIFAVVLNVLSALPWDAITLQHVGLEGLSISFRGCLPASIQTADTVGLHPGAYVKFHDGAASEESELLDVSRYFYTTVDPVSVAMHIGEDGFFDPLAGQRV